MNILRQLFLSFSNASAYTYTGNYTVINGDDNNISNEPYGVWTYGPNCLYFNGSTYSTFKQHLSVGQRPIVTKYNGTTTTSYLDSNFPTNSNYHHHPTLCIDSSGYIYLIFENHGAITSMYKSDNPEDITGFSLLQRTGTPEVLDYPKTYSFTDGFIQIGRRTSDYGLACSLSSDGISWTKQGIALIANESQPGETFTDPRYYPMCPINPVSDGFIHQPFTKRITKPGSTITFPFPRLHWLKTPTNIAERGKVWYNFDETWNKNVYLNGEITATELITNCTIWEDSTLTNRGDVHSIYYKNNNLFGQMYRDDLAKFVYFDQSAVYDTNFKYTYVLPSDRREKYVLRSTIGIIGINVLNNEYDGISSNQPLYNPTDGILYMRPPYNIDDIPSGQKFVIMAGTFKNKCYHHSTCPEKNDVIAMECIKK